jgi:hypothetical protein
MFAVMRLFAGGETAEDDSPEDDKDDTIKGCVSLPGPAW